MTFANGTKVRYKATIAPLDDLNGIEGIVTESKHFNTTFIKVTKGSDSGHHDYLIGKVEGFSTSSLVEVPAKKEIEVGDRVRVNDPYSRHHDLVGVVTDVGDSFGRDTAKVDVDESCETFLNFKKWNPSLDGKNFYLTISTLELVEDEEEKPLVGGAISYEQVERGQRIRVSYESKGLIHSREGIVGVVTKNTYIGKDNYNWTINLLDDEAERYGGKGQRLNWGSDKVKETIVLLEAAPEVDAVLERLLESKGGTVVRAFSNEFFVRDAFSDTWRNWSSEKSYSSETLRREAGDKIVFFVEDKEGN